MGQYCIISVFMPAFANLYSSKLISDYRSLFNLTHETFTSFIRFAFQDSSLASLLNTRANQFDEILQACNISKAQFEKLVQILKTNLDMSDSYSFTGDVNIYDNDSLD